MSTGTEKRESSCEPLEKCVLCGRGDVDPDIHGHTVTLNEWILHEFCVVFSTKLVEQATSENINEVSSVPDLACIISEAEKTNCFVCGKRGASITCAQAGCDRSFHLPCASEGECVTQYFDEFRSFCGEHRPQQEVEAVPAPDTTCIICTEPVGDCVSYSTMVCPACQNAWFHRACIQGQAMNAGMYFFKCPLCREIGCFFIQMRFMGIRIPARFPTWDDDDDIEFEPQSHNRCNASECHYQYGREEAETEGPWELLLCSSCAAQGIHRCCSNLRQSKATWVCNVCAGEASASSSNSDSDDSSTTSQKGLGPSQGSEAPQHSTSSSSSWAPQSSALDFASQGAPRSSRPSRAAGNLRSKRGERAQTRSRSPHEQRAAESQSRTQRGRRSQSRRRGPDQGRSRSPLPRRRAQNDNSRSQHRRGNSRF